MARARPRRGLVRLLAATAALVGGGRVQGALAQLFEVELGGACTDSRQCEQGPPAFSPVVCAENRLSGDGQLHCCRAAGGCCMVAEHCCGNLECAPSGDGPCSGFGVCVGAGQSVPPPAGEPAPAPPTDPAGAPPAGAPGSLGLGAICNTQADCAASASGTVVCADNGIEEDGILNCCLQEGGVCNGVDSYCCGDLFCVDGVCTAGGGTASGGDLPPGAVCTGTVDCSQASGPAICGDNGLSADGALTCCLFEASPCASDAECCAGLVCDDNQIAEDGALTCCGFDGVECASDAGCCADLFCVDGMCQAVA
jgi:hypothetical protein